MQSYPMRMMLLPIWKHLNLKKNKVVILLFGLVS